MPVKSPSVSLIFWCDRTQPGCACATIAIEAKANKLTCFMSYSLVVQQPAANRSRYPKKSSASQSPSPSMSQTSRSSAAKASR